MSEFAQIGDAIRASQRIVILSHARPDGDAIGSQVALGLALEAAGKSVILLNEDGTPESLRFLPGSDRVVVPGAGETVAADLVIALDTANRIRLGANCIEATAGISPVINIDHHKSNELYGDLNFVDPESPASGQIVFELLSDQGLPINADIVANLFVAISTDTAPLLAHVPFLLDADGARADLHLVRSNPICRALGTGLAARLDVVGPDGYISPDWYGLDDQVPTWNYVAVALVGRLVPLPPDDLPDLLARQSAAYEARLAPKPPWTMDKMSGDTRKRFLRMILPYRLEIDDMQSTWKLGQNKPEAARQAASAGLRAGFGSELEALQTLMADPPE